MKTEFEFIRAIKEKSAARQLKSNVKFGIGDDCAVIGQNGKKDLVVTTDLLVEDVDFRLEWTKPEFIGHKALAVSLSDVAAMGAKPVWALISIGVPKHIWQTDFVEQFYRGWFALAKKYKVELIGGDVSKTPDKIVVDSIVAGAVKKNCAVRRSGAKPGDLIFVTGKLGAAAAGLQLLENGFRFDYAESSWRKTLMRHQLRPTPQTQIGAMLGKKQLASAMIDLSDGLSSDLTHLCAASKVGAKIFAEKIPIHTKLRKVAQFKSEALALALDGGEDFELLFTAPKKNYNEIFKHFPAVSDIGEISEKLAKIELASNSETVLLQPQGFQHFS